MVISSNVRNNAWKPHLEAEGQPIDTVGKYTFLGITMDSGLRFSYHIEMVIKNCKKRVNILKCLAGKAWGNSLKCQRKIYFQYIRSCLEYALSSGNTCISETNRKRLNSVQNEGLRAIAGLTRTCPVDILRLETNIEQLFTPIDKWQNQRGKTTLLSLNTPTDE